PMPSTWRQRTPIGRSATPHRTAAHDDALIPTNLPTTSPTTTPTVTRDVTASAIACAPTAMPALASANTGTMTKLDQPWSACSSRSIGATGTRRPSTTPANVGWTPDAYRAHHSATPSTTNAGIVATANRRATTTSATIATAIASHRASTPDEYHTAMTTMAPMSSTMASVNRKRRTDDGAPRPTIARTPSANAMSVAIGIPHPRAASPDLTTARNSSAGTTMPPTAAMIGNAAVRRSRSSPRRNS